MQSENSGRPSHASAWDAVYDFLDDIFASAIPGAYFISFFFFVSLIYFQDDLFTRLNAFSGVVLALMVLSLCYCFGTVFQRSDIKALDKKSALHIYKHQTQNESANSYAFAPRITNDSLKLMISSILNIEYEQKPKDQEVLGQSWDKKIRESRWKRNYRRLKKLRRLAKSKFRAHKKTHRSMPKCEICTKYEEKLEEINKTIRPSIEYPYDYLYDYLKMRDMDDIAEHATWAKHKANEHEQGSSKKPRPEKRSKMKTNEYKVKIVLYAPHLLPIINKNEADIRFMNAMCYAAKALFMATGSVVLFSLGIWSYQAIITKSLDLLSLLVGNTRHMSVFLVSTAYFVSACYVPLKARTIMHYQRVRELVFILEAYDYAKKAEKKITVSHTLYATAKMLAVSTFLFRPSQPTSPCACAAR